MRARRPPWLLLVWGGAAAVVAAVPLVHLVTRVVGAGGAAVLATLSAPRTLELLARSAGLTAAVTAACLVLGTVAAWLVARTDLPGRRFLAVLLPLPLAVPSYVAGFTWASEAPWLAGFPAAFAVLTAVSYPYVLLPVLAALAAADGTTEEVARSLGCSRLRVALTVTWPRVRPAATAGGLLVALYVLSDFGAVSLLRFDTLTLGIFTSYRGTFDRTPAYVLGLLLVLLAVAVARGEARARGRAEAPVSSAAGRPAPRVALGRLGPVATAGLVGVLLVALGVPVASLLRWSALGAASLDVPDLFAAALTTAGVSLAAAVVTTLLAVGVGVLGARWPGRATRGLEELSYLGHALPGLSVGLAVVALGVAWLRPLYQTTTLLVLAYAVLFLPLAVGAVRAAVQATPPRFEEVARTLGRGPLAALAQVTAPRAAPGVAAGATLVFLTVAKELPATLLLRPTGTETLAVRLWSLSSVSRYAAAAPYAAVLVLVAALPVVVLLRGARGGAG
jgi:iron(III) transport system permease protein